MEILLFEPEIPPNTGNVARLCAATQVRLNLVEPLGFSLEDRYLKRAGLDYWPHVQLEVWPDMGTFVRAFPEKRLVMTSARAGEAVQRFAFLPGDVLVFGPETRGLPEQVLALSPERVRIPVKDSVRSLNLSTAAGIVLYQALIRSGELGDW
jgi:tRNA (cytidine/uridine-2'-O-)-methyltransferase